MTDSANQLNNQQIATAQGKSGTGKFWAGVVAAGISSFIMNRLSLHGVNFEVSDGVISGVKLSSEFVKSSLEGGLTGFLVWITPSHIVAWIVDCKKSLKDYIQQIKDA